MSIDTPHRARIESQRVARIHVVTPREQIQSAMQAALHELVSLLQTQSLQTTGPWFAHHHHRPTDTFDFDVCFPIGSALVPSGRVHEIEIPATDVIRTVYHGPYDGLPTAWPEFVAWIAANGYKTRQDAFEVYTVTPREEKDPAGWCTELNYPLMDPWTDPQGETAR